MVLSGLGAFAYSRSRSLVSNEESEPSLPACRANRQMKAQQ